MSLVAYASSDDSEGSDSEEVAEDATGQQNNKLVTASSHSQTQSLSNSDQNHAGSIHHERTIDGVLSGVDSIVDDDDEIYNSVSVRTPTATIKQITRAQSATHPSHRVHDAGLLNTGLKLPPPKGKTNDSNTVDDLGFVSGSVSSQKEAASRRSQALLGEVIEDSPVSDDVSVLKGLPAPRQELTPGGLKVALDDELEDEVKPKSYGSTPQAPPAKTRKKPKVKITVPSLQDFGSDDDSDDDEPKKKIARSSSNCGLFSLLPSPKNVTIKESKRVLIPHTLSKKPGPQPLPKKQHKPNRVQSNVVQSPHSSLVAHIADEDSDEDTEDTVNFFSLCDKNIVAGDVSGAVEHNQGLNPGVTLGPALRGPWKGPAEKSSFFSPEDQTIRNVTSVDSRSSSRSSFPSASSETASLGAPPAAAGSAPKETVSQGPGGSSETIQGPQLGAASEDMYVYQMADSYPELDDLQGYMQDQEFLKMQGRKHRGREQINIIDVCADDKLDASQLVKNISQETTPMTSHSRKNKDLPSSQQRRKHQITYLAYQAKERELELKNQWSENRMTRKQNQSKYGF